MDNITTLRPGEHFMFKDFEWVCGARMEERRDELHRI